MAEIDSTTPLAEDRLREVEAVLARRIEQADRDRDRLRRTSRISLAAAGMALLTGAASLMMTVARTSTGRISEAVEAHRFVLRDPAGEIRATLDARGAAGPRISLLDRDGRPRMQLALTPDGSPGVSFSDRAGRPRAVLGLLPDETTSLVFADEAGQTRVVLGYAANDAPSLVFADRDGVTRAALGIEASGGSRLSLVEDQPPPAAPGIAPDSLAAPEVPPSP